MRRKLFVGSVVHAVGESVRAARLELLPLAALGVGTDGRIEFVEAAPAALDASSAHKEDRYTDGWLKRQLARPGIAEWFRAHVDSDGERDVRLLTGHQLLMPGFVDTHTHAPQYVNAGLGLDLPLLKWLERYTFPRESEFSDTKYARSVYCRTVRRHLVNGSTTCVYFGTVHTDGTLQLAEVVRRMGQRALVGKVNQDQNSPPALQESTQQSLRDTEAFVDGVLAMGTDLVQPIITPRFAPSCTATLMQRLGELAASRKVRIQSHLSENADEIAWVRELFPEAESYTDVYARYGLLTATTIMAHCIHLSPGEVQQFAASGATVSHCPTSNFDLVSGICPVRHLINADVAVSLGTDVSGGYHPGMLDAIRSAITASKALCMQDPVRNGPPLTVAEAVYLATMGGAAACGLERQIGNFESGKDFDALLVDLKQLSELAKVEDSEETLRIGDDALRQHIDAMHDQSRCKDNNVDLWTHDDLESMFNRLIYLGDDRNIRNVWVRGVTVKE